MWIVIPTCKQYSEMYDRLMTTITKKENIITVLQMETEETIERTNQGYTIKLKRNLHEYGAWIGVQMLVDAGEVSLEDFYLMIHDTCLFGSNTYECMESLKTNMKENDLDVVYLLSGRFHNMCIARRTGISVISNMFSGITSMSKDEAISYETKLLHEDIKSAEYPSSSTHVTTTIPYSNHKHRRLVYVPSLDMIKFYAV